MSATRPLVILALALAACAPGDELPSAPQNSAGPPQAGPPPVSNNAPPVAAFLSPVSGTTFTVGDPVTATVGFTDPDPQDTHTCSVDWQVAAAGGTVTESAGTGTCTGTFPFPTAGTYTIQVWVTDNSGATSIVSTTVDVQDPPPAPPPPPPSQPPPPPTTPPTTTGAMHGSGAIATPSVSTNSRDRRRSLAWFEVSGGYSRAKKLIGDLVVSIPGLDPLFLGKPETFTVQDARADLRGTGRLGRRVGTYSFLVSATDGGAFRRQDKIRIKIWNGTGVVFDTDPGAADDIAPTKSVELGRIVVRK